MAGYLAKIFKNHNFLSLANNGAVAIFGFLSFVILVRSLPTVEFGEWVLFITTLNFIDMLRFGITRTAIVRFLSGADSERGKNLIGSNYTINLMSTIFLIVVVLITNYFFADGIKESGFTLFFTWFPVIAILNLPFNNSLSILQAKMRFDLILVIRMINVGLFMLFLIVNFYVLQLGIIQILWAYLITNFITSVIASIKNWDGVLYIFKAKKETNKLLIDFGKYTSGTLIGSNLLRSADTFIIGLSPFMGVTGVALYSIPLKLTEIIEIPVRSFAMTAFPKMSKASIDGNKKLLTKLYYENIGLLTFILIPLMILSFIFAEDLVTIVGGEDYRETAGIFQVFCIYGLLLPLDRFTGVALDSINMPKQNFIKVIYMTASNIVGDSIVVFGLYYIVLLTSIITMFFYGITDIHMLVLSATSYTEIVILNLVAFVTILFTIIGIIVGNFYLRKHMHINLWNIFPYGFNFFRVLIKNNFKAKVIVT